MLDMKVARPDMPLLDRSGASGARCCHWAAKALLGLVDPKPWRPLGKGLCVGSRLAKARQQLVGAHKNATAAGWREHQVEGSSQGIQLKRQHKLHRAAIG